jgi:hypothetical protein
VDHPYVQAAVREVEAAAGGQAHAVVHAVAGEQQPQLPFRAVEFGPQRMLVGAQRAQGRDHPGRPAADPLRPAVPFAHQLRIDAWADGRISQP